MYLLQTKLSHWRVLPLRRHLACMSAVSVPERGARSDLTARSNTLLLSVS